jgi:twitching motility protein PilI
VDKRQSIREFQTRLAHRLAAKDEAGALASWLAVELCEHRFLLPLEQAGELYPQQPLIRVPYVKSWFLGLANLRGGLFGVVDLAHFLGLRNKLVGDALVGGDAYLVALPADSDTHCALAVDRLLGLKSRLELTEHVDEAAPVNSKTVGLYRDPEGKAWQEIDLIKLAQLPEFLDIHERPLGA